MTMRLERRSVTPWAGLFLGALGWFVDHQGGSDTIFWDCHRGGPLFNGGLGLVCALVVIVGGLISWRARKPAPDVEDSAENHGFAGLVGAGAAGLFLMAIVLQTLNGFILSACQR